MSALLALLISIRAANDLVAEGMKLMEAFEVGDLSEKELEEERIALMARWLNTDGMIDAAILEAEDG